MPDDEFDAALEAALAASDAAIEAEETPADEPAVEATEEAVEEQPQLRDEAGRFLPKFDDPDVQSLLEKYDGDVSKALRAAVELQSVIGRQGQELGELRSLKSEIEQLRQMVQTPSAPPPNVDAMLEENPGALAHWAYENGREDVYEQAMDAWFEFQPRQAARFEQAIMLRDVEQRMQSAIQPIAQPVAEQTAAREIVAAQRDLGAKYADFNEILSSATEAELRDFPRDVAEKAQTGTYQEKIQALETLYRWVKAERVSTGPMTQTDDADVQRQAEADEAKIQAAVVSASSSPAREGKSGVQEFKNFLLEPDPTNWRTGLT